MEEKEEIGTVSIKPSSRFNDFYEVDATDIGNTINPIYMKNEIKGEITSVNVNIKDEIKNAKDELIKDNEAREKSLKASMNTISTEFASDLRDYTQGTIGGLTGIRDSFKDSFEGVHRLLNSKLQSINDNIVCNYKMSILNILNLILLCGIVIALCVIWSESGKKLDDIDTDVKCLYIGSASDDNGLIIPEGVEEDDNLTFEAHDGYCVLIDNKSGESYIIIYDEGAVRIGEEKNGES